jgi:hypothetical protein
MSVAASSLISRGKIKTRPSSEFRKVHVRPARVEKTRETRPVLGLTAASPLTIRWAKSSIPLISAEVCPTCNNPARAIARVREFFRLALSSQRSVDPEYVLSTQSMCYLFFTNRMMWLIAAEQKCGFDPVETEPAEKIKEAPRAADAGD